MWQKSCYKNKWLVKLGILLKVLNRPSKRSAIRLVMRRTVVCMSCNSFEGYNLTRSTHGGISDF